MQPMLPASGSQSLLPLPEMLPAELLSILHPGSEAVFPEATFVEAGPCPLQPRLPLANENEESTQKPFFCCWAPPPVIPPQEAPIKPVTTSHTEIVRGDAEHSKQAFLERAPSNDSRINLVSLATSGLTEPTLGDNSQKIARPQEIFMAAKKLRQEEEASCLVGIASAELAPQMTKSAKTGHLAQVSDEKLPNRHAGVLNQDSESLFQSHMVDPSVRSYPIMFPQPSFEFASHAPAESPSLKAVEVEVVRIMRDYERPLAGGANVQIELTPDPSTSIRLEFRQHAGGTHVQGYFHSGDAPALIAGWPQLQEKLSVHGIILGDLHLPTGTSQHGCPPELPAFPDMAEKPENEPFPPQRRRRNWQQWA